MLLATVVPFLKTNLQTKKKNVATYQLRNAEYDEQMQKKSQYNSLPSVKTPPVGDVDPASVGAS